MLLAIKSAQVNAVARDFDHSDSRDIEIQAKAYACKVEEFQGGNGRLVRLDYSNLKIGIY